MNHDSGTYVSLELSDRCRQRVDEFSRHTLKLDGRVDQQYLHSTVIYSSQPVPQAEFLDRNVNIIATHLYYDLFKTQQGKTCLTSVLESHMMSKLNDMLIQLGATSRYLKYTPHLTLSYDYSGSIINLPVIPFELEYDRLIVKPLDIDFIPPST